MDPLDDIRDSWVWPKLKANYDDDPVDRLNYVWTHVVLWIFGIFVGLTLYAGKPLNCWVPAQFEDGWESYAENYCFVENTYWVPVEEYLPGSLLERKQREIHYYQWVPFVLALQAILFYLPRKIWQVLCNICGLDVTALVQSCFVTTKAQNTKTKMVKEDNSSDAEKVAKFLHEVATGSKLTTCYLLCKCLWILNATGQLLILNRFLGPKYTWWGLSILRDIISGTEWETSGHFPRVTFCDFEIMHLGNVHRFSVQCVLKFNMFNEKIYLFLWFWFLIVAVVTSLNLVYWLSVTLSVEIREGFLQEHLRATLTAQLVTFNEEDLHKVSKSLASRIDLMTVLRLIALNAGDIAVAEVVNHLWKEEVRGSGKKKSM